MISVAMAASPPLASRGVSPTCPATEHVTRLDGSISARCFEDEAGARNFVGSSSCTQALHHIALEHSLFRIYAPTSMSHNLTSGASRRVSLFCRQRARSHVSTQLPSRPFQSMAPSRPLLAEHASTISRDELQRARQLMQARKEQMYKQRSQRSRSLLMYGAATVSLNDSVRICRMRRANFFLGSLFYLLESRTPPYLSTARSALQQGSQEHP